MSPFLKRYLITSVLAAVVVGVGFLVARGARGPVNETPIAAGQSDSVIDASKVSTVETTTETSSAESAASNTAASKAGTTSPSTTSDAKLSARVPVGMNAPAVPTKLGSLDPSIAPFEITFAGNAAGITRIVAADFWGTVDAADQAKRARAANDPAALPSDSLRYVFADAPPFGNITIPVFAAREVQINGAKVDVFGAVWAETAPGAFVTEIVDDTGRAIARVERSFVAGATAYDLALQQRIINLTDASMKARILLYGPGDPPHDPVAMMEVRRFHFGYLYPLERDPSQSFVSANGQYYERADFAKQIAAQNPLVWPNTVATEGRYALSWFGSTDRYFALAVHAPYAPPTSPSRQLLSIAEVRAFSNGLTGFDERIFTTLWSPVVDVAVGASTTLDIGIFAGPLDPKILDGLEPYSALNMGDLIVYLMSGCCSWCTFAWLADGMLWFLSFLHDYVVFDWGLAIIALVIVVRFVLHPLQKKSQISMQRFSRAMTAMKPELDSLQKKFKDDPARMQQEQMRMFRERGVSPAGCVGGMLPTFAQMPIWMALYAVLFFAFELRQQPAFFGIFQNFGGWSFLADLAQPDRFFVFGTPLNLYFFSVTSINLLPVLMGIVFWVQQQYMAPPMAANMTDDQISQQKMMKWMMVIMFPVMTYAAPSGLTLYILTSTCIGIVEGRIIKKQVDAMDFTAKPEAGKKKQDFLGRLYEKALARSQQSQGGAKKKFKDPKKDR
jgi:YidC/Oxa1 family membrane protein insertase